MMCACGADDDVLSLIGPADVQKTTFSDDRRHLDVVREIVVC